MFRLFGKAASPPVYATTVSLGRGLNVWRSTQGGIVPTLSQRLLSELFDLHFTADGKKVGTAGREGDNLLTLWDADSGQRTRGPYTQRSGVGRVRAFAFSRD